MRSIIMLAVLTIAAPAVAQQWTWKKVPGLTSAELAATGWQMVGATTFSLGAATAGSTFWAGEIEGEPVTLNCFDIAGPDPENHTCSRPVAQDQ